MGRDVDWADMEYSLPRKKISPDSMTPTGDDIRTELAYIRTGLAAWGAALLLFQRSWLWTVFFGLGLVSIWRARNSIL